MSINASNPEMKHLTPFVQWAQHETVLLFRVEVKHVKDPQIEFGEDFVYFRSIGEGQKGVNDYEFRLKLWGKIDAEDCVFKVNANFVEMTCPKAELKSGERWWQQVWEGKKPGWLKVDFARWQDKPETEEEKEPDSDADIEPERRSARKAAKQIMNKILADEKRREINPDPPKPDFFEPYILTYNLAMFIAFAFVVIELCHGYYTMGTDFYKITWSRLGTKMKCCQVAMFLDVFNGFLRITKTKWHVALIQCSARFHIIFITIGGDPVMQDKPFVFFVFFVYSAIEIIRYPFYALATKKMEFGLVTWLRYNAWIILYPMGMMLEGTILLRSIPLYSLSGIYSLRLPNRANFAFEFAYFQALLLTILMPAGAYMVNHMRKQRLARLQRDRSIASKNRRRL